MVRIRLLATFLGLSALTSCAVPDYARKGGLHNPIFPNSEFERFLSTEQKNLSWENISNISESLVWKSDNHKLLAITKNGKGVALIEPGQNSTTYYLFGSGGTVMRYRVNNQDVEGAIVDFVYEAL